MKLPEILERMESAPKIPIKTNYHSLWREFNRPYDFEEYPDSVVPGFSEKVLIPENSDGFGYIAIYLYDELIAIGQFKSLDAMEYFWVDSKKYNNVNDYFNSIVGQEKHPYFLGDLDDQEVKHFYYRLRETYDALKYEKALYKGKIVKLQNKRFKNYEVCISENGSNSRWVDLSELLFSQEFKIDKTTYT